MSAVSHIAVRRLTGLDAARIYVRFPFDPLATTIAVHAAYGPFVIISDPLPLIRIRRIDALAVGPVFNREILTDADTWRTIRVAPRGGPGRTSIERLSGGIIRMRGARHAHYRRLLAPPLKRESIEARGDEMERLAAEEVASWPLGETIDLAAHTRRLVRNLGIGLLFGDDRERGYQIADMISRGIDLTWSMRVAACPINSSVTPYGRMVRAANELERRIVDWADSARGKADANNLLSIIVNSPDENDQNTSPAAIVGLLPTMVALTYETCQNALIWTLILLAQHPRIAHRLCEELDDALGGGVPVLSKLMELPLLDAVIRESMRLLPPVPTVFRVALRDTSVAGEPAPRGMMVALSIFLTNRNPDLYTDPDCFRPRRWETIRPTPFEYPVFGVGERGCAGSWFGLSAVKTGLATILSRYRIELLPQRIDHKVRATLSPKKEVRVVLHRRNASFKPARLRGSLTRLVRVEAE